MKFSIIVPAYNEEKLIGRCLRSIKRQSRKPDEVIVVDNCCKDRTSQIAEKLGAFVVKEPQKGISPARNKGAKVAKGDILCFVDADGIVSRDWLKNVEKNYLSKRNIKAVTGLNIFIHKNPTKTVWYNTYTVLAHSGLFLYKLFTDRLYLTGNNTAIRKEVFWKLGGFERVVGEDYYLSKKFWKLRNNKGVFDPKMVIRYSSRGFDAAGYFKTLACWVKSAKIKISQEKYDFKNKIFL